jgi:hypothetical protein
MPDTHDDEHHIPDPCHFAGNSERILVSEFDYDAIDRGNPLAAELERDEMPAAADALGRVMDWCWREPKGNRRDQPTAYRHFLALSAVMRPDLFDNVSYTTLAKENGITKAWISKLATQFQDEFGIHFRRSRRQGSRDVFRQAQLNRRKAS